LEEDIIDCFYNGITDPVIYRGFGRNRPKTIVGLRDMMHDWFEQEEKMRERFLRRNDSSLSVQTTTATTRASVTTRVHPESTSQTTSSWLWIIPREARRQQHRRSSKSSYKRNAHGIQVPIMRQFIATTSGEHLAILVVARRTSQWTKNPKTMTKGTNCTTQSFRMPQRLSTSSSGEMETSAPGGKETASPGDHVRQDGNTTPTLLVGGPHLILL
jgi:hypothetical protein